MSKLIYPSDGIYKYCRNYIDACSNNLSNAVNNCNLDVPSGFSYKNYLSSLSSELNDFYREINSIDSKLQKSNNNYDNLASDLSLTTKRMSILKIKDRDRMIV